MAYIGKTPAIGNFVKLDSISVVNGQASYTMQNGGANFTEYSNVNQFLVSLNGILQSPTDSFTVSSSTITFASNLVTGDVIDFIIVLGNSLDVGVPSDNTVTAAKIANSAVDLTSKVTGTLPVANGGTNLTSGFANGITMADQWRLTANVTAPSGDITTNLERNDTTGYGKIGTGMTESSGIFSFPSTGIYKVEYFYSFKNTSAGDQDRAQILLNVTTNNSSYTAHAEVDNATDGTANGGAAMTYASSLVDVTDTSNVKVKFTAQSFKAGTILNGSTDRNATAFTFIRLGDT